MKKFSSVFIILTLSGCSMIERAPERTPANHLPDEYVFEKELKIFTGPGLMQAEYPIASSLKHAELEINIAQLPAGVECKTGEIGRFSKAQAYKLRPYLMGGGDSVYCRYQYDGRSDYPTFERVNVTYKIANRTKGLPFEESREYKEYDSMLDELEDLEPGQALLGYAEEQMESVEYGLNSENGFRFELEANAGIVEITSVSGEAKFSEGWFRSEKSGPEGVKPDGKMKNTLVDPERRAYELICALGDKTVYGAEFESIFVFDFTGKIECFVNLYHKYAKKKHEGSYKVQIKRISHADLKEKLEGAVDTKAAAHKDMIERIWREDIQSLDTAFSSVRSNQVSSLATFQDRVKQIDRQKFEVKRDQVVNGLFRKEVKGVIGRGVSVFTFTPVQKKYFLPDGTIKSKTYLALKGATDGLFKSREFSFDFKYTPFGEDFNVFLYAEDQWKDGVAPIEMRVCLADKKNFYQDLFTLQKAGNSQELYIKDYLTKLSKYEVNGVESCVVFDGEEFSLSRKDEYFWFAKSVDDSNAKVESFGTTYEGKFNESPLSHIYENNGPHPLRGKTVPKRAVSGVEKDDRFVIQRDLDGFVIEP